jgi:hypothetical protein
LARLGSFDYTESSLAWFAEEASTGGAFSEDVTPVHGASPGPLVYQGSGQAAFGSVTVSEAVAAGDTIIVAFQGNIVSAPTDSSSNTYVDLNSGLGGSGTQVWGVLAAASVGAGTLVITPPAPTAIVSYIHYSGVYAFDSASSDNSGSTSTPDPGNVTPSSSGETIVAVSQGTTAPTAGSGFTLRLSSANGTWQDKIGAGSGSQSSAFSGTVSFWEAVAVTLIPAPAIHYSYVISESVTTPSDSVSRVYAGVRAISESVTTPSDVVSKGLKKAISESVTTPVDSVSKSRGATRSISEAVPGSSSPTPAYVQFAYKDNTATPLTITLTGTTAGNIICVMGLANEAEPTWGTPTDGVNTYAACTGANAQSATLAGGGISMNAFWTVNGSSGTRTISVPFTGTQGDNAAYAFEISGATTFDVGKGAVLATVGAAGTATTGTFTTNYHDLIVCAFVDDFGSGLSVGSGYTIVQSDPDWGFFTEQGLFASGTNAGTVTSTFLHDYGIIAAAFGAPPGGGPSDSVSQTTGSGGTPYTASISESVTTPSDSISRAFVGARTINESVATPFDGTGSPAGYVQHAIKETSITPGSPQTVTLSGTTAGNAIVVVAFNQGGASPIAFGTPTDGANTYGVCTGASVSNVGLLTKGAMYAAYNIAGGNVTISVPWTTSGNEGFIALYAFELSDVSAFDIGGGDSSTSATADAGTFSTSFSGEIIIGATINAGSASSVGTGYTLIELTASYQDILEYKLVGAGSQSPTVNLSGSQAWAMVAGAFYGTSGTISRQYNAKRTIAESVTTPSDSVSRAFVGFRSISESVTTPSDSVSQTTGGGTPYTGSISESVTTPSDSVSRAFVGARSISESVTTPSDSISRAFVGTRSISESVTTPSDAVTRAATTSRSISESVTTPSDSVTRALVEARSIAESVTTPSDSVARATVEARAIAESVTTPSDSVTRLVAHLRSISESVTTPSDAVTRATVVARSISESVTTPSDAVSRALAFGRTVSESVTTPSDALTRSLGEARSIAESVTTPSDAVTRFVAHLRSISESVTTPSDAVARALVEARSISESVTTPSDSVSRSLVEVRSISESVTTPSDAVTRAVVVARSIAESVSTPSDSIARAFVGFRSIAESVTTPSDSVTHGGATSANINESVTTPSDSLARAFIGARAISESVTIPSDAVARTFVGHRSISESVTTPSDSVSRVAAHLRSIAESVTTPSDALTRAFVGARAIPESITTPSDAVSHGGSTNANISESVTTPSDAVTRLVSAFRSITESVTTPSDAVTHQLTDGRLISESVTTPSDALVRSFVGARTLTESVTTPSDVVTRIAAHARSLVESVTTPSDTVSRIEADLRNIFESVTAPSDSVTRAFVGRRALTESVSTPTDAVAKSKGSGRTLTESVTTPSDAVSIALSRARIIAEAFGTPFDSLMRAATFAREVDEFILTPFDAVSVVLGSPATTGIPQTAGLLVAQTPQTGIVTVGPRLTAIDAPHTLTTTGMINGKPRT